MYKDNHIKFMLLNDNIVYFLSGDIRGMLEDHDPNGFAILEEYDGKGSLSHSSRVKLVQFAVSLLMQRTSVQWVTFTVPILWCRHWSHKAFHLKVTLGNVWNWKRSCRKTSFKQGYDGFSDHRAAQTCRKRFEMWSICPTRGQRAFVDILKTWRKYRARLINILIK